MTTTNFDPLNYWGFQMNEVIENHNWDSCKELRVPYCKITEQGETFDFLIDYYSSDKDCPEETLVVIREWNKLMSKLWAEKANKDITISLGGTSIQYLNIPIEFKNGFLNDIKKILEDDLNALIQILDLKK
jgi:hypothetical protein